MGGPIEPCRWYGSLVQVGFPAFVNCSVVRIVAPGVCSDRSRRTCNNAYRQHGLILLSQIAPNGARDRTLRSSSSPPRGSACPKWSAARVSYGGRPDGCVGARGEQT